MSTSRLHSQLSFSVRKSAELRGKLESGQLGFANGLLLRCRCFYHGLRTEQLIQHLHSAAKLADGSRIGRD